MTMKTIDIINKYNSLRNKKNDFETILKSFKSDKDSITMLNKFLSKEIDKKTLMDFCNKDKRESVVTLTNVFIEAYEELNEFMNKIWEEGNEQ